LRIGITLLILGLAFSIALPVVAVAPLASTLWNLQGQGGQVNSVITGNLTQGIATSMNSQYHETSMFNMTLVAFYPKTVITGDTARSSPTFLVNMTWFIFPPRNVTEFQFGELDVYFYTAHGKYGFSGQENWPIDYQGLNGTTTIIQNFTVLVIMEYGSLSYGSSGALFSYVGSADVAPIISLQSSGVMRNANVSLHFNLASFFDLGSYPTTVYYLSVPASATAAFYGGTIIAVATVASFVYTRNRQQGEAKSTHKKLHSPSPRPT
jgi:hypothetical protein